MALALDGFKVLRRIGKNADCFGHITADVNKAAHALLLKRIKAKSATPLKSLRDVADILGGGSFSLFVDGLTDTEVKSVLTRSDKHSPLIRYANAGERRIHLVALAGVSCHSVRYESRSRFTLSPGSKSNHLPRLAIDGAGSQLSGLEFLRRRGVQR